MPPAPSVWYSYAIVRVVPRVERGEFLNVGVILFARTARFLAACIELDRARLRALAPDVDALAIGATWTHLSRSARERAAGGPIARLPAVGALPLARRAAQHGDPDLARPYRLR